MTRGVLAAIIATLLISSTVSIEMKLSHVQEKRLKELDQEKWGHIILRFAELHNLAGGPFDDLKSAVEQLIADLGDRVNELDEEYNQNTLDHQSEVTRLQDEISDAQIDVASTDNLLNNVLYPAIDTLKAKIETLHNNINENNKYVEKITFERENGHAEYETRVSEQNDALSAVDECLNILEQVSGGNISFIQSKQLKNSLDKVAKTLNKGADEVIVKALIALASEEFADQAALLKVFNALKEVKQAIQDGLDQDHNDEARAQSQYDSEQNDRNNQNRDFQREILLTTDELQTTEDRTAEKEAFFSIRKSDLSTFESDLTSENSNFDAITASYEDIRAELVRETSVANDTLAIVANSGFANYLANRV